MVVKFTLEETVWFGLLDVVVMRGFLMTALESLM
jgi:hypothetical protein